MNKKVLFSSTIGALALSLVTSAPVFAMTMEQRQSFSMDVSSECSGTCTSSVTHSFSGSAEQHQFISDDNSSGPQFGDFNTSNTSNNEANVHITWSQRGGTCTIRYGESRSRSYPYSTTAACDEGEATIGGLVRGRAYRFQIMKDNGTWSRAITRIAR